VEAVHSLPSSLEVALSSISAKELLEIIPKANSNHSQAVAIARIEIRLSRKNKPSYD